ncbi:hypothetical protein RIF29_09542 [Crotalaria pallida]|uniref:Uncharacterized protein n=1 Tax=Crotalaria pallida TaxID=3830 RepID=A0AAN9FRZ4_CROPI
MGTEILIPSHDYLQGRLRPHDAFSLTKSRRNTNPSSGRTRRRSPPADKSNFSDRDYDRSRGGVDRSTVVVKGPGTNLVMGQVKILKRGEKLPEIAKRDEGSDRSLRSSEENLDVGLGSTDRLGPDPSTVKKEVMVKKQIRVSDLKDGSKKQIRVSNLKDVTKEQNRVLDLRNGMMYAGSNFDVASPPPSSVPVPLFLGKKNGSATSDLRRLLRLDSV